MEIPVLDAVFHRLYTAISTATCNELEAIAVQTVSIHRCLRFEEISASVQITVNGKLTDVESAATIASLL
ncbi:MAG: hypothetical protein IID45_13415, partial [Planctomycetes bacterium]|nr:hypothetical protein [Planctomycetota bacterium]